MRTTLHIEAGVRNDEPLHRSIPHNVIFQNLLHIRRLHPAIPDRFRIHHHRRSVLALIKASGFIRSHLPFQSPRCHTGLEELVNFGPRGITRSFGMSLRPLVGADEDVSLKFRHFLDVSSLVRSPERGEGSLSS